MYTSDAFDWCYLTIVLKKTHQTYIISAVHLSWRNQENQIKWIMSSLFTSYLKKKMRLAVFLARVLIDPLLI